LAKVETLLLLLVRLPTSQYFWDFSSCWCYQQQANIFTPLVNVIYNKSIFFRFNNILRFTKINIFIFLSLAMSFFVVRQTLLVYQTRHVFKTFLVWSKFRRYGLQIHDSWEIIKKLSEP